MQGSAGALVSEEEFLALPETTVKTELVDGEVVVSPNPSYWHREVLRRLVVALSRWADSRTEPVTIGQAPLDVRFAPGRILQPDAMAFLTRLSAELQGPVDRVPEVCIEVLSTNRVYDRLAVTDEVHDVLRSPVLPGFVLDVGELLAR